MIEVRAGREDDLGTLTEIYNHYIINTHVTFDIEPFTIDQRRAWMAHYPQTGPYRLLVAVEDDRVLGYATSSSFMSKAAYRPAVSTTVYCSVDYVGCGAGTALYRALFDVLADEDVHRAYAGVALPNDASLALHRRFGFREVGTLTEPGRKFGRWWDVMWLERAL